MQQPTHAFVVGEATSLLSTAADVFTVLVAVAALVWSIVAARQQQRIQRLSMRPWLSISGLHVSRIEPGKPIDIHINFQNAGLTPAVNAMIVMGVALGKPDEVEIRLSEALKAGPHRIAVVPQQTVMAKPNQSFALTGAQLAAVASGDLVLAIGALARYEDQFGTRHVSSARGQVMQETATGARPAIAMSHTGNEIS